LHLRLAFELAEEEDEESLQCGLFAFRIAARDDFAASVAKQDGEAGEAEA
jgi:hypothetical protein